MAADSNFVKTSVSGSLQLRDATATPVTLDLAFDRGDLVVGPIKEVMNEDVVIERRGRFVNVAHGSRIFPTSSFSAWFSKFQASNVPGAISDWVLRQGPYAALVSTLGSGPKVPFASDAIYTIEGSDFGDSADHTFTLHDVQWTIDSFTEANEGCFFSLSGVVRGEIDGDLTAAEYTP